MKKKNLMKKALAVTLSVAMACAGSVASAAIQGPITASAATVSASTFRTVTKGDKIKIKLKNNTKKWKIMPKKTNTKDEKTAKVLKVTDKKTAVVVKGKKVGRTNLIMKLKSDQTKKQKKLKCKINVVKESKPDEPDNPDNPDKPDNPDNPDNPTIVKEGTATTQEELTTLLADSNMEKVTISTQSDVSFEIADNANCAKIDLIVDAPNASITNSAKFKSITINQIKENTWIEKAIGNLLKLLAPKARVVVEKDAKVAGITVGAPEGTTAKPVVNLEVNGEVENVAVEAATDVAVKVAPEASVAAVSVAGEDAAVALNVEGTVGAVAVDAKADVAVEAAETAKVESVAVKAEGSKLDIKSGTVEAVSVETKGEVAVSVAEKAAVKAVDVKEESAAVKLEVNGAVEKVNVDAASTSVTITSTTENKVAAVPVTFTEKAKEAAIETSVPVAIETAVSIKPVMNEGAEGSSVKVSVSKEDAKEDVKVEVVNNSKENVTITDSKGDKLADVGSGTTGSATQIKEDDKTPGNTGNDNNNNDNNDEKEDNISKKDNKGKVSLTTFVMTASSIKYTDPTEKITPSSITFTVDGLDTKDVSGGAIKYQVTLINPENEKLKSSSAEMNYEKEGKVTVSADELKLQNGNIVKVQVVAWGAETSTYKRGADSTAEAEGYIGKDSRVTGFKLVTSKE